MGNCLSTVEDENIDHFSLDKLVSVLNTGPLGHRILAAQRCTALLSSSQGANRVQLLELDALKPLMVMLQEANPLCRITACQALCNLALSTDSRTQQAFLPCVPSLAPQLRELLLSPSAESRLCGCQTLSNLAQTSALALPLLQHIGELLLPAQLIAAGAARASAAGAALRISSAGGMPNDGTQQQLATNDLLGAGGGAAPAVGRSGQQGELPAGAGTATDVADGVMGGSSAAAFAASGIANSTAGAAREHLAQFFLNSSLHSKSAHALEKCQALPALIMILQDRQAPAATQEKSLCALYNVLRDSRTACAALFTHGDHQQPALPAATDTNGPVPSDTPASPPAAADMPVASGTELLLRLLQQPASANCQFLTACVMRCAVATNLASAAAATVASTDRSIVGAAGRMPTSLAPTAADCVRLVGALQTLLLAPPQRRLASRFTFGSPQQLLEAMLAAWHVALSALRTHMMEAELSSAVRLSTRSSIAHSPAPHQNPQFASPSRGPSNSADSDGGDVLPAAVAAANVMQLPVLNAAAAERLVQLLDVECMEPGLQTALLQLLQLLCGEPPSLMVLHRAGLTHRLTHLLRQQPDNAAAAKALRNVAAAAAVGLASATIPEVVDGTESEGAGGTSSRGTHSAATAGVTSASAADFSLVLSSPPVLVDFVTALTQSLRHSGSAEVRKQGLAALISLTRSQPRTACHAVVQGLGCEAVGGLLQQGLQDSSESGRQLAAWSAALLCQLYVSDVPCQQRIDAVLRTVMAAQHNGHAAPRSHNGTATPSIANSSFTSSVATAAAAAPPASSAAGHSLHSRSGSQSSTSRPASKLNASGSNAPPTSGQALGGERRDTPPRPSVSRSVVRLPRLPPTDSNNSAAATTAPVSGRSNALRKSAKQAIDEIMTPRPATPIPPEAQAPTQKAAAAAKSDNEPRSVVSPHAVMGECALAVQQPAWSRPVLENIPPVSVDHEDDLCCCTSPEHEGDDARWGLNDSPPAPPAAPLAATAGAPSPQIAIVENARGSPASPKRSADQSSDQAGGTAGTVPPIVRWNSSCSSSFASSPRGTDLGGSEYDEEEDELGEGGSSEMDDGLLSETPLRASSQYQAALMEDDVASDSGGGRHTVRSSQASKGRGWASAAVGNSKVQRSSANGRDGGTRRSLVTDGDEDDDDVAGGGQDQVLQFLTDLLRNCDIRYLGSDRDSVEVV